MIAVSLDSAKLDFALQRLASAARVDLGKVVKQEGETRKTLSGGIAPKSTGLSDKARQQGENAIKSDLFGGRNRIAGGSASLQKTYSSLGIFQRIGSSSLVPPKRGRTQTIGVNLGWERGKKVRIMEKFWRPGASLQEMQAFHRRYRDKYGRIGFVTRSTIGRWQVQDQLWIENARADTYLALMRRKVGWSKAGFAPAAIACGIRVPAWIRNKATKAGTEVHSFGEKPFITATATRIKIPDPERYVRGALAIREKTTLAKVKAILANRAVNLGFAKIDGAGRVQENMPR
jgi:hypothetical protein